MSGRSTLSGSDGDITWIKWAPENFDRVTERFKGLLRGAYEAIPGTAGTKEIGLGFAFAGVCVLLPLLASAGIPVITSELRKRGLV